MNHWQTIGGVIQVVWTLILTWQSVRLYLLAADLERQRQELRRWVKRQDSQNQERI